MRGLFGAFLVWAFLSLPATAADSIVFPWSGNIILDTNVSPVAGARLDVYAEGTTTRLTVYLDRGLTQVAANPIIADGNGSVPLRFLGTPPYKVTFSDADGAPLSNYPTADGLPGAIDTSALEATTAISRTPVVATSVNRTATTSDRGKLIAGDASGGDITQTLPAVALAGDDFEITIKNVGASGTITVDGNASETIEGRLSIKLPRQYDSVVLVADGGQWLIKASQIDRNPVGTMLWFAGDTLQPGYRWCNAEDLSRTTYAELFAVTSTTYGAADGSTFKAPDVRGRALVGQDDMGGVTSADRLTSAESGIDGDTLGASGGSEAYALTEAELAVHDHTDTFSAATTHSGASTSFLTTSAGSGGDQNTDSASGYSVFSTAVITLAASNGFSTIISGAVQNAGSGDTHLNVQPSIVSNCQIKIGLGDG